MWPEVRTIPQPCGGKGVVLYRPLTDSFEKKVRMDREEAELKKELQAMRERSEALRQRLRANAAKRRRRSGGYSGDDEAGGKSPLV